MSKYEQEWQSRIGATIFPILSHHPRDAGTIAQNGIFCDNYAVSIFFLLIFFNEVPYNNQVCHLMSMNGGQTLNLSYFQHIFILRVTPGH